MRKGELAYCAIALVLVLCWLIYSRAETPIYLICALFALLIYILFVSHRRSKQGSIYEQQSALFDAAFRAGDLVSARQCLRSLEFMRQYPIGATLLDMNEAVILCYEERFNEARALLQNIDSSLLSNSVPSFVPYLINNLAVCDAHLGAPGRAIESLAPYLEHLETVPADLQAAMMGTVGIARFLKGECSGAVSVLEEAMSRGGMPLSQSIRALYLGEAYSALGETAKAQAAYKRAIEECPTSKYAERARQKSIPQKA